MPLGASLCHTRLDVAIEELQDGGSITSIYDIEPHSDFETSYPQKNRFTQAQIAVHHQKPMCRGAGFSA